MEKSFKVVAEYSNDIDASVAKGMLEANGITVYLESNNMATLYGAGSTWAPIQLYVHRDQFDAARRLLEEHGDKG